MADSDDDDDHVPFRSMTLRTVLGKLLDAEEFDGVEEDDDALDDLLDDMAGGVNLASGEGDDEYFLEDDDGLTKMLGGLNFQDTDHGAVGTGRYANVKPANIEAALQRQIRLDGVRKAYGMTNKVRLDEVDISEIPSPHAWLTSLKWSEMMSESGRVHTAIRNAIDLHTSDIPPPMGRGNTYEVPSSIAAIKLPRWARFAPRLRASNTVSTIHTNCEPNQERLATNHNSTTYNPNSFAANKMKRTATGLFFRSGSGVIAGARGQLASLNACYDFIRLLQRMDMMPFEPTCKLQNIVSNATCFPIDLDLLAQRYPVHARYEKDRFPGLVFRFGHGNAWVFIIFPSGNVIGTGVPDWCDENLIWRWLFAYVLIEFRDSNGSARETPAEKKNRLYNNDAIFASTMRAISAVGFKRTYAEMLRVEVGDVDVDLRKAWHEIVTMPETNFDE